TRPEGLGGSRNAGPAVAGPRPPYVTEAHGYAVQRLRPYGPYGPYEGRNDEGPAPADLETFFLPTAGELTAKSTLFFFDLSGSYGYGKRPRCYSSPTASSFPLERSFPPDFFGCFFRPLVFRPFLPSLFFLRPIATTGTGGIQQFLDQFEERVLDRRVLTEDLPWPAAKTALLRYYGAFDQIRIVGYRDKLRRHEARRPKTKDTIDWLEKHAFLCRKIGSGYGPGPGPGPGPNESTEHSYGLFQALPKEIQGSDRLLRRTRPEGLGGSRDAGPAVAGPRPPYVTEAVRHSGCTRRLRHGYAVQRLRPYGPYGPYEGRNVG
ncbi:hypothetical protein L249_5639, partial [Ophiocordyceps polyrhachis-furcata BCC 54312]